MLTRYQFTVPEMALRVVDRAIQVHGAEGISQDQPLAYFYASLRTLRFADVRLLPLFHIFWRCHPSHLARECSKVQSARGLVWRNWLT